MKVWFSSLTQRERIMVQAAASVLVIFIIYLFFIDPINNNYIKNKKNVASAKQTLEWMKEAASEVKSLGGSRSSQEVGEGTPLNLSTVDHSVRNAGLASVMKRVQPEGKSGVRVWFENAPFDEVVSWLSTIESQHGLFVNEINVEQTESTGFVNVRVFLES